MKSIVALTVTLYSIALLGAGPDLKISRRKPFECFGSLSASGALFHTGAKNRKKYLVTFAHSGLPITGALIQTLSSYATSNNAKTLVLVAGDPKKLPKQILESDLFETHTDAFDLSPNITVSALPRAKEISPFEGAGFLYRPGALNLIAHPRFLSASATSIDDPKAIPMTIASTGSMNDVVGDVHSQGLFEVTAIPEAGAIFVEVDPEGNTYWRQLRFMFSSESGYSAIVVDSN